MAIPIIGEILGDNQLVILADGTDLGEVSVAAKSLQTLTPHFAKSDPPGALITELSWAAVVQLASLYGTWWRPQPRLQAWITDQVQRRTSRQPLSYRPPAPMVPYWWQAEGADLIAATGRALITDEPGVGKTAAAILGVVEWNLRETTADQYPPLWEGPVIAVCPASVVDNWVREWQMWAPHVRAAAWRDRPQRKGEKSTSVERRAELIGTADVYVTSFDLARADAGDGPLKDNPLRALKATALVIDECFPAGTMVTTPAGVVPIETLQTGDKVIGVDHSTGEPTVTTVKGTRARSTDEPLVKINSVEMTPNHPVWTSDGYTRSDAVHERATVCRVTTVRSGHADLHAELRMVPAGVHPRGHSEEAPAILRDVLLSEMAMVNPGLRRVCEHTEESRSHVGKDASLARERRSEGGAVISPARPWEPLLGSGCSSQGPRDAARAGLPHANGRERPRTDGTPTPALGAAGLGDRSGRAHQTEDALPPPLQDRRGLGRADDRRRVGRGKPQEQGREGSGRQEGRPAPESRVDGAAILEQGSPNGSGQGRVVGQVVYNIETGTGNYVAGGLLVHNCHFVKNGQAARTKAVVRLGAEVHKRNGAIIGLSGTPITRNVSDLHPMLKILAPGAWPDKERMLARYALSIPGDYDEEILGLNPWTEAEFHLCLLGQHRRVKKDDVLADLPPKAYTYRTVELPAKWRKAYDQFEDSLYAELPDGTELSVMDVQSAYTHLSTLSSAPGTVEVTYGPDVDEQTGELKRHVHIELLPHDPKAPGWKVAALLELLAERKGLQSVVFAPSRQLIEVAGAALAHAGLKVGYVVGGQSAGARTRYVDAFQAHQLDVLLATTGAGGVGLTFTAADTVIVLQRPWELDHSIQLEDRLHRIGAEHESIQIIDIIAKGTIDTRRRESLKGKVRHLAEVVQDPRLAAELLGGKNAMEHPLAQSPIGVAV